MYEFVQARRTETMIAKKQPTCGGKKVCNLSVMTNAVAIHMSASHGDNMLPMPEDFFFFFGFL